MAQELLVSEKIDAGADFVREFNKYLPVAVAFWIRPAESDEDYLYIASDQINDQNFYVAYGEVLRLCRQKIRPWINPFRIKLLNANDPPAANAIEIRDHYHVTTPLAYTGSVLGGLSIEGAFIYPPL